MTARFAVPRVVVSGCLEFEACRYNGQRLPFEMIGELEPFVEYVPVCPEVEIGLGTPRDPIRLVRGAGGPRLVQPSTDRDLTRPMERFAKRYLADTPLVDGFILKNRSPSCGLVGVKVYDGSDVSSTSGRAPGLFAAAVIDAHPEAAMEDEGRLRNYRIREHFLTKLFALARLRQARSMRDLVAFQSEYKLILMTYNQQRMRELGRLVANAERRPLEEILRKYRMGFGLALRTAPRYTSVINTIEHAYGYMSDDLSPSEKRFYRNQLRRYREARIPLSTVTGLIHAWAVRFEVKYLLGQRLFQPFPEELTSLSDSGKGRLPR